jgi:hypothetical protein
VALIYADYVDANHDISDTNKLLHQIYQLNSLEVISPCVLQLQYSVARTSQLVYELHCAYAAACHFINSHVVSGNGIPGTLITHFVYILSAMLIISCCIA